MALPKKEELKFVILHNFSHKEISLILSAVKSLYPDKLEKQKLVFSKTTDTSRTMTVEELVDDTSSDHLYLLENPPKKREIQ